MKMLTKNINVLVFLNKDRQVQTSYLWNLHVLDIGQTIVVFS